MAYRPGQGIKAGTTDKLRQRKLLAEICEICGKRTEEGGLDCATVDDSKQWATLLGEGTGSRKKARCAECTKPLPEDHDPALGPFCPACAPSPSQRQAPAPVSSEDLSELAEFLDNAEVQFGHLVRPGVCKRCTLEKAEAKAKQDLREREEAKAKKDIREQVKEQALKEGILEVPELVAVSMSERPFGMSPCKEAEGFLVAAVKDGKPAARAGVRPGWRVAQVAGISCEGLERESVLALTKEAELPCEVVFQSVPNGGDFCTSCQKILVWAQFSRKMRTKPPDKRRCTACVEAAGGKD